MLINPGAENGLTGWWADSPLSAAVLQSPSPNNSGSYSFLGTQLPVAFITQTVELLKVPPLTTGLLDSGRLLANFSLWFADRSPGSGSFGRITLTFLDASKHRLGQGLSGTYLHDTGPYLDWFNAKGSFQVPIGTRFISYTMDFLTSGSVNTGMIDDNELRISPQNF
jgi:hypothetical protein